MKEYTVVSKKTLLELETEVNRRIADGWVPIGGFFISSEFWYYQPMVR